MKKILVVGGGPAGMTAALTAAQNGAAVTLLEKMPRCGKKLSITGKGRGNITNTASISDMIKNTPGNGAFLNSALRAFDNKAVINLFESLGVPTKTERGGRVFPASDRAADIVNALIDALKENRVNIVTETKIERLIVENGKVCGAIAKNGADFAADAVIVAAGGASYPATGSSGDGARLAAAVGHTVVPLLPALVPLETEEEWVKTAAGLTLKNVRATLIIDGKKCQSLFGEMLLAHFGVTGPIILSLSREAVFALAAKKFVEIELDLKPALDEATLDARLQREFNDHKKQAVKNVMSALLPGKLIAPVLDAAYLSDEKTAGQITRQERHRLLKTLKALPLTVTAARSFAEAIVTAGGVSVKEIDPKTMESKLVTGLYFAGETIDIDAFTGGFNLQAAFATGHAAGLWAAQR